MGLFGFLTTPPAGALGVDLTTGVCTGGPSPPLLVMGLATVACVVGAGISTITTGSPTSVAIATGGELFSMVTSGGMVTSA